jgi:hypothetical protein
MEFMISQLTAVPIQWLLVVKCAIILLVVHPRVFATLSTTITTWHAINHIINIQHSQIRPLLRAAKIMRCAQYSNVGQCSRSSRLKPSCTFVGFPDVSLIVATISTLYIAPYYSIMKCYYIITLRLAPISLFSLILRPTPMIILESSTCSDTT